MHGRAWHRSLLAHSLTLVSNTLGERALPGISRQVTILGTIEPRAEILRNYTIHFVAPEQDRHNLLGVADASGDIACDLVVAEVEHLEAIHRCEWGQFLRAKHGLWDWACELVVGEVDLLHSG